MLYPLILVFVPLFFFLSWRHLNWGLYLVLVCLPAYGVRFALGPLPMTLLELMILILFVVWLVRFYQKQVPFPQSKFLPAAILILVIATVAMFLAPDLRRAAGIWKAYFLEPVMFFIVLMSLLGDSRFKIQDSRFKNVILALGVPALAISVFGIIQKIANGWLVPYQYWYLGEGPRVTSFFSYPNAIGLFVAPVVMLFIAHSSQLIDHSFKKSEIRNWKLWGEVIFSGLVIITGILAIWFARSEGAIVGLAAGLIIFGLLFNRKARLVTIVFLFSCFLVFLSTGLSTTVAEKLTFHDWSGSVRLSMWGETWQMLKDHWFLGAGLTGYQTALVPYHQAKYLEIFLYPHNFVLNFWVELGLLGLLTFLYIIGKFFYLGFKIQDSRFKKLLANTLIAVMVVILVHGLVDVPYFKNDLAVMWWVWVGLMSSLSYIRNKNV
jgi:O-antigen ligase